MTTPQAKKLLTMLEAVNDDTAVEVLDEIDARFDCFINEDEFDRMSAGDSSGSFYWAKGAMSPYMNDREYTRDRNALKAVRDAELEGYGFRLYQNSRNSFVAWMFMSWEEPEKRTTGTDKSLHTEEIAEAHAIIQAIDWKREND